MKVLIVDDSPFALKLARVRLGKENLKIAHHGLCPVVLSYDDEDIPLSMLKTGFHTAGLQLLL